MSVTIQSVRLNSVSMSVEGVIPPPSNSARLTYAITGPLNVSLNLGAPALNITIDWGDGSDPEVFTASPQNHTYPGIGTYEVSIEGNATTWSLSSLYGRMTAITSWGDLPLESLNYACYFETLLTSVPDNIPPTVTDISNMFYHCASINDPNISNWDTSNITTMYGIFDNAVLFNQPLDSWNTSKVTQTFWIFRGATAFNQPLNSWDMSKVFSINGMFRGATAFNQDLDQWNVSSVSNFTEMFSNTSAFNGNISNWNVSNGTNFISMFQNATAFNGDVSNWNTVKATIMDVMFNGATSFGATQNLSGWHVPRVPAAQLGASFAAGSQLPLENYPIPGTP
jgi:surface protein